MENKKNEIRNIIVSVLLWVITCSVFAQDTSSVDSLSSTTGYYNNTLYYALCAVAAVYEIAIRLVPTIGNYSLLSFAYKLLQAILPNFKKDGGKHS